MKTHKDLSNQNVILGFDGQACYVYEIDKFRLTKIANKTCSGGQYKWGAVNDNGIVAVTLGYSYNNTEEHIVYQLASRETTDISDVFSATSGMVDKVLDINDKNVLMLSYGDHQRHIEIVLPEITADEFVVDNQSNGVQFSSRWATIIAEHSFVVPLSADEWQTNLVKPHFYGDDYQSIPSGNGEHTVSWASKVVRAGYYEAFVYYPYGTDNNSQAHYRFSTSLNKTNIVINQQQNAGSWVSLGQYYIQDDGSFMVELSNKGDGETVADAIKLVEQR